MKRVAFLIAMIILFSCSLTAQWVQTNSPFGRYLGGLAVSGANLVVGYGDSIYVSTDNGTSWPLTTTHAFSSFTCLAASDENIFAGGERSCAPKGCSYSTMLLSSDGGISWTLYGDGHKIDATGASAILTTHYATGGDMGSEGGEIEYSTNSGLSWESTSFTYYQGPAGSQYSDSLWYGPEPYCVAVNDTALFAAIPSGVLVSTDRGISWTLNNSGLTDSIVSSFIVCGGAIFAGTSSGVFMSTNNGTHWTAVNNGLPNPAHIGPFAVSGANLFVGTGRGVFLTTNNGKSWSDVNTGLTDSAMAYLAVSKRYLFGATVGGAIWKRPLSEMVPPNPYITQVTDVPVDQGGKVSLFWSATHLDTNTTTLPYYSIWRSISQVPEQVQKVRSVQDITPQFKGQAYRTTTFNGKDYAWEWIGNQPAHKFTSYSYTAPTLFDSVSGNNGMHYFLVSAHTNHRKCFMTRISTAGTR